MNDGLQSALSLAGMDGLLSLVTLGLATLVSEDLACISAGLLVARGSLAFGAATGACFAGILGGDLLLVLLGRTVGRRSLELPPLRWWVSRGAVQDAERWFARRGPALILASRFMPGTRLATYVAAGVLRAPLARLAGWFVLACALWTPLLVGAAVIFGEAALRLFATWSNAVPPLLGAGLLALLLVRLGLSLGTWRGRRLLLGRWRRLTRWEFWPRWAVYAPVVVHILRLGWRHRGLTLFTAVNPGISAGGGLVGESKSEILAGLAGAGKAVASWVLLAPGEPATRLAALDEFMRQEHLGYPIVLKPDVGARGAGVVIVPDRATAGRVLREAPAATIAQAYVPGVEFGIFYHRLPSAAHGGIFSITDKRIVAVNGNGRHTLEELILADDRAVCLAPFFLERWAGRLDEIPEAGRAVALSELGTHCRGALFLDGTHLVTPALSVAVERISRTLGGFHFGRYDVRADSVEALQDGEFKVIELNGLTSEATSIYDPGHSVWFGWRTLCHQWDLAFAIAAENRANGVNPLTWRETWHLVTSAGSP